MLPKYPLARVMQLERHGGQYFADQRLTVADLKVFVINALAMRPANWDHILTDLVARLAPGNSKATYAAASAACRRSKILCGASAPSDRDGVSSAIDTPTTLKGLPRQETPCPGLRPPHLLEEPETQLTGDREHVA